MGWRQLVAHFAAWRAKQRVRHHQQAMAKVWDQDPEARGGAHVASTAEDIAAFFNRVRGS